MEKMFYCIKGNNFERHCRELSEFGALECTIFSDDRKSRKKPDSQYNKIKNMKIDCICIPTLSCIGYTDREIYKELCDLMDRNISFQILDIPSSLNDETLDVVNQTILEMYSILATRESKRQQRYRRRDAAGRKPTPYPDNWDDIYDAWKNRKKPVRELIQGTNLARSTFYYLIDKYEKSRK